MKDKEKQMEALLENTIMDFMSYYDPKGGVSQVPLGPFERANQALALLKSEQCTTYGGSKEVPDFNAPTPEGKPFAFQHRPCPDCQSQEPARKKLMAECPYCKRKLDWPMPHKCNTGFRKNFHNLPWKAVVKWLDCQEPAEKLQAKLEAAENNARVGKEMWCEAQKARTRLRKALDVTEEEIKQQAERIKELERDVDMYKKLANA